MVPWIGLQCWIVVFPHHTHLLFGTEAINYNNGSVNILDLFQLLYFAQQIRKYPSDISISKTCFDRNL